MEKDNFILSLEQVTGLLFMPCESSNIKAYAYESKKELLWIVFKSNSIYAYKDVPYPVANGLFFAQSKGQYHAKYIKGNFDFDKYTLEEE